MKVLIISHNPMSTKYSIGKTLMSLFSSFKKEEICQLYIHTGLPECNVCSSFFQVTDKAVLKGVITRKVVGKVVDSVLLRQQALLPEKKFYKKIYANAKKKEPYKEILRDLMWELSPWYNRNLINWIEEQKPTCIFVAIGSGKFLYNMALRISKNYHLPIYTYICDDFYSMKVQKSILGLLWKKLLVKKTWELLNNTTTIVSICDELRDYYSKEFNRPAVTVMTGTSFEVAENITIKEKVTSIRYFGKLSINRYKSMADICRVVDEINAETGKDYSVEIYCGEISTDIINEFRNIHSAKFCGFVTGEIFKEKFYSSDILIHVEAFDEASIDRVKYSVSTKIADSLASGITLFAYGPENVASIRHLIRNKAGIVVSEKNEIRQTFRMMLEEKEMRIQAVVNEIEAAKKYHNPMKVSEEIHNLLSFNINKL